MSSRLPTTSVRGRGSRAFTLVEILIVVVILGILAAIVTPQFAGASQQTSQAAFVADLLNFEKAMDIYVARTGQYPGDGSSGQVPAGFEDYVRVEGFEGGTPVGGVWDIEYNDNGVTSAVGVHFNGSGYTQGDAYMSEIDAIFDDGNVGTGRFRRLAAGRYYLVVAE